MSDLSARVRPVAKAVAAFVVPLIGWAVGVFAGWLGVDVAFDPSVLEALVTSVVSAGLVWLVSNSPAAADAESVTY